MERLTSAPSFGLGRCPGLCDYVQIWRAQGEWPVTEQSPGGHCGGLPSPAQVAPSPTLAAGTEVCRRREGVPHPRMEGAVTPLMMTASMMKRLGAKHLPSAISLTSPPQKPCTEELEHPILQMGVLRSPSR